jgi:predicted DNA-binding transcriptional regulator YafY
LSADQTIEELDHERVLVRASVENTAELRWWLLGFGELVEVLAPADLREEFHRRATAMATLYQRSPRAAATRRRPSRKR